MCVARNDFNFYSFKYYAIGLIVTICRSKASSLYLGPLTGFGCERSNVGMLVCVSLCLCVYLIAFELYVNVYFGGYAYVCARVCVFADGLKHWQVVSP